MIEIEESFLIGLTLVSVIMALISVMDNGGK